MGSKTLTDFGLFNPKTPSVADNLKEIQKNTAAIANLPARSHGYYGSWTQLGNSLETSDVAFTGTDSIVSNVVAIGIERDGYKFKILNSGIYKITLNANVRVKDTPNANTKKRIMRLRNSFNTVLYETSTTNQYAESHIETTLSVIVDLEADDYIYFEGKYGTKIGFIMFHPGTSAIIQSIGGVQGKDGITPEQTQAIVDNTSKTGITPEQTQAIVDNTSKHQKSIVAPIYVFLNPDTGIYISGEPYSVDRKPTIFMEGTVEVIKPTRLKIVGVASITPVYVLGIAIYVDGIAIGTGGSINACHVDCAFIYFYAVGGITYMKQFPYSLVTDILPIGEHTVKIGAISSYTKNTSKTLYVGNRYEGNLPSASTLEITEFL